MLPPKKRLLDQVRDRLRLKNYSYQTEKSLERFAISSQATNLSLSGLREPTFVGLGQNDGLEDRRLRKRVSHS